MIPRADSNWKNLLVSPQEAIDPIRPGMSVFIGTGVAEPRTLLKYLLLSDLHNARDLELVQVAGYGDTLSINSLQANRYRLKTFFSGWVSSKSIATGRLDLIPTRFSQIRRVFRNRRIHIDVAFLQITPPNEEGYCSLGVAVDVAREIMEQATLLVAEINERIPFTHGDTIVSLSDFDFAVLSTEPPFLFDRFPRDPVFEQVGENIASIINDGDCINFSIGSLFEALAVKLTGKRHLGVHSPYMTDALMDLIRSGAVTNYRKSAFRGKSLVSYAHGTDQLMQWLNKNPLVEFQCIDKVSNPVLIGQNDQMTSLFQARKVDLLGGVAFHPGYGVVAAGPSEAVDFVNGAEISAGGKTIVGLTSRNARAEPNILLTLGDYPNQFMLRDAVTLIVTEYGIANISCRSIRERAQAIIDIAHPDDREQLFLQAKKKKYLYPDQIFLRETARFYPSKIYAELEMKGEKVRIRATRPSDEEAMRRFFYRFSDQTVYFRFFYRFSTMPHDKIQPYVNVDYSRQMSLVALSGEADQERIVAEGRYLIDEEDYYGNVAFMVDESYRGAGLASYLLRMLVRIAREKGLNGFTAEVLVSNKSMMRVFEKINIPFTAKLEDEIYRIRMPFKASKDH